VSILSESDHADLVREADLDWHAGYPVGEDVNRYSTLIRAVERAVVEKMAAMCGELPPCDVVSEHIDGYSEDAMHEHYARGVAAGMSAERARCVAACEAEQIRSRANRWCDGYNAAIEDCVVAISKPAPDDKEQTR
jgi:hypothetical protein